MSHKTILFYAAILITVLQVNAGSENLHAHTKTTEVVEKTTIQPVHMHVIPVDQTLALPQHVDIITEPIKASKRERFETQTYDREYFDVLTASPDYTVSTHLRALFLKPSISNVNYAAETFTVPVTSPRWHAFDINPKIHFGFDLGATMFFHSLDSALSLNWERFHSSDCKGTGVSTENMVGPFFEVGPDSAAYKKALGTVHFKFDQVSLDYGQLVDFGDRLQTNIFGGINVMRLCETRRAFYSNDEETITRSIKTPTRFIGAGPEFGVDARYALNRGFTVTGNALVTILSGKMSDQTIYESTTPALADTSTTNVQAVSTCKSRFQVVPGFEERIGLAYHHDFYNRCDMELEVGYQAQVYLNVLQSVDIATQVPALSEAAIEGVYARSFHRTLSNFSLAGPYIALDLRF